MKYEVEIKVKGQETTTIDVDSEDRALIIAQVQFVKLYSVEAIQEFVVTVWKREPVMQILAELSLYSVQ